MAGYDKLGSYVDEFTDKKEALKTMDLACQYNSRIVKPFVLIIMALVYWSRSETKNCFN